MKLKNPPSPQTDGSEHGSQNFQLGDKLKVDVAFGAILHANRRINNPPASSNESDSLSTETKSFLGSFRSSLENRRILTTSDEVILSGSAHTHPINMHM